MPLCNPHKKRCLGRLHWVPQGSYQVSIWDVLLSTYPEEGQTVERVRTSTVLERYLLPRCRKRAHHKSTFRNAVESQNTAADALLINRACERCCCNLLGRPTDSVAHISVFSIHCKQIKTYSLAQKPSKTACKIITFRWVHLRYSAAFPHMIFHTSVHKSAWRLLSEVRLFCTIFFGPCWQCLAFLKGLHFLSLPLYHQQKTIFGN